MQRIWIDITTTIVWWRGHPTGVQRVLYNYAKRFNDDPMYDVHYFALNQHGFYEMSFAQFEETIFAEVQEENAEEGVVSGFKSLPTKIRGKGLGALKKSVRKMPVVGAVAAAGYRGARSLYRRAAGRGGTAHADISIFAKDDIVLLMDGNWHDHGRYAREIIRARGEVGFTLCHLVHDVIAIANPAYANLKADVIIGGYFKTVLPHVDRLLCISQCTMDDVLAFAKREGLRVTDKRSVVRLGDPSDEVLLNDADKSQALEKLKTTLPPRFALYVSTIEIRKNHHLFFSLYKLAAREGIDLPPLVIAGKKGWMVEETLYMLQKDPDLQKKVHILFGIDDATLKYVYENCLFTVLPSFYEGWGLPVVESLLHGKVTLAANESSLPEAGGELADYFSPFDVRSLLELYQKYSNDATREARQKYIAGHYKPYTWEQSYSQFKASIIQR